MSGMTFKCNDECRLRLGREMSPEENRRKECQVHAVYREWSIQDQSKYLAGIDRSQHERNRKQYAELVEKEIGRKRVTGEIDAKNAMRGEIWNGSRTVTPQGSLS